MLAGKPLIAWTIESSQHCGLDCRTIVSTEDLEIAEIAKEFGAEVPFFRPSNLAQDNTPDYPVCIHAIDWLMQHEQYHPDLIIWLRPTTPMRLPEDIKEAIIQLLETDATGIRSICSVEHHPYWMKSLKESKQIVPLIEKTSEKQYYQRQLLPPVYRLNGAVDITWTKTIKTEGMLYGSNIQGYLMPNDRSLDIDTEMDFMIAEFLLNRGIQ